MSCPALISVGQAACSRRLHHASHVMAQRQLGITNCVHSSRACTPDSYSARAPIFFSMLRPSDSTRSFSMPVSGAILSMLFVESDSFLQGRMADAAEHARCR